MRVIFLTVLVIFTIAMQASAAVDWANPPSEQEQYRNSSYTIPQKTLKELRKFADKNSGYVTKQFIFDYYGVRTSSGGGGGIACFESEDAGEEAVDFNSRQIKKDKIHTIKWLVPYDLLVENDKYGKFLRDDFVRPRASDDAVSYLNWVLDTRIGRHAPALAQVIRQGLAKIPPAKWLNRSPLPVLNDTGDFALIVVTNHPKCKWAKYVQLVVRYQLLDGENSIAEADYNLMNQMRITNQFNSDGVRRDVIYEALTILHEIIYERQLLRGYFDSSFIRMQAGYLLSTTMLQDVSLLKQVENSLR